MIMSKSDSAASSPSEPMPCHVTAAHRAFLLPWQLITKFNMSTEYLPAHHLQKQVSQMLPNSAKSFKVFKGLRFSKKVGFLFYFLSNPIFTYISTGRIQAGPLQCIVLSVGSKINSNHYLPELQSQRSGHSLSSSLECSVIGSDKVEGNCDAQVHWRKFGANVGQEIAAVFLEEAAL